jgi:hypothetical protein
MANSIDNRAGPAILRQREISRENSSIGNASATVTSLIIDCTGAATGGNRPKFPSNSPDR